MDYSDLTLPDGRAIADLRVVDLKSELDSRNLPKSGNKKDLVQRLSFAIAKSQGLTDVSLSNLDKSFEGSQECMDSSFDLSQPNIPEVPNTVEPVQPVENVVQLEQPQELPILPSGDMIPPKEDLVQQEKESMHPDGIEDIIPKELPEKEEISQHDSMHNHLLNQSRENMETEPVLETPSVSVPLWTQTSTDAHSEASSLDFEEDELVEPSKSNDDKGVDVKVLTNEDPIEPVTHQEEITLTSNADGASLEKAVEMNHKKITFHPVTMETDDHDTSSNSINAKAKKRGLKDTVVVGHTVDMPKRVNDAQPTQSTVSSIVNIRHLVRPFTLNQLKDVLVVYGSVKDVWLDRIKSKAFVVYEQEEDAVNCRDSLDGCRWPSINPKALRTDYATVAEYEWMKEHGHTDAIPPRHLWDHSRGSQQEPQSQKENVPINVKSGQRGNLTITVKEDNKQDGKKEVVDHAIPSKPQDVPQDVEKSKGRTTRPEPPQRHLEKKEKEERPNALDQLFRKTKAEPSIYWLPVSKSQIQTRLNPNVEAKERQTKPEVSRERKGRSRSPPHFNARKDGRFHNNRVDGSKE